MSYLMIRRYFRTGTSGEFDESISHISTNHKSDSVLLSGPSFLLWAARLLRRMESCTIV